VTTGGGTGLARKGIPLAALLLAIGVQVQLVLPIAGADVQIALSDPLVAVALFPVVLLGYRQRKLWLSRPARLVLLSILVLSLAIAASAVVRMINADVSLWALKKLAGWPALIAYLVFTGVLWVHDRSFGRFFTLAYVTCASVIALPGVVLGYARLLKLTQYHLYDSGQIHGLTETPISFVLLTLLAVFLAFRLPQRTITQKRLSTFVTLVLVSALFFSESRAGVAASGIVILLWMLQHRALKHAAKTGVLIGTLLLGGLLTFDSLVGKEASQTVIKRITVETPNTASGQSRARINQYQQGWEIYAKRPLLGAGLGAYVAEAPKQPNGQNLVIHNTAFWLLVEAGPFGFLALLVFVVSCLVALWPWRGTTHSPSAPVAAVFWLLVAAGGISLFHEILYQRVLWVALGLGLASLLIRQGPNTPETEPDVPSDRTAVRLPA